MTLSVHEETTLKDAIDCLEEALLTPVAPRQVIMWVLTAQNAVRSLDQVLPQFLHQVLHSDVTEAARSDSQLLAQVDQLVESEQRLLACKESFLQGLSSLAGRLPHRCGAESEIAAERLQVEQRGVELLGELKRLQTAARRLLHELLYRDRGTHSQPWSFSGWSSQDPIFGRN